MLPVSKTPIDSIEILRAHLPDILAAANSNEKLALAAAINPVLFLEDLGYELSPVVVTEIEERGRFSKRQIVRRRKAVARIDELAGGNADLSSAEAISSTLERLQLNVRPDITRPGHASGILNFSEAQLLRSGGKHALVEALIEFRRIEEAAREFAPQDIYTSVRAGKLAVPSSLRLTARLSTGTGSATKRARKDDA